MEYFDIKPETPISSFCRDVKKGAFPISIVLPLVGMSETFAHKVIGRKKIISWDDVLRLLDQDAFQETFVPRSKIADFLQREADIAVTDTCSEKDCVLKGDSLELIPKLPDESIQCVVTSTPYWAMRVYDEIIPTQWADGEVCPFGLEQTPEAFIRHSVEVLYRLKPKMTNSGSVWWNIMDSYNTRTQIRSNAAEALRAMQGKDKRSWKDHQYKRYSAGHSFLKDGELCMIPQRIAERASRIGYYLKSIISWCKTSSLPEPQNSRVSRNVEYILHLSSQRTPLFIKDRYLSTPEYLGGRQKHESEKLSDSWHLPTSSGKDGHGAQFPLQLPGRCIALTTNENDLVLDPFAGAGTTLQAAQKMNRRFLGFDISDEYIAIANKRLADGMNQLKFDNI